MEGRLSDEELAMLRLLDTDAPHQGEGTGAPRPPKRLFELGLVTRPGGGEPRLSALGKRALFQRRCIDVLRALGQGGGAIVEDDARQWLLTCQFIRTAPGASGVAYAVTERGRAWLDDLDRDGAHRAA
ncbi:hypothetical protein [Pseudoduganella namucuonensis]|uniref:Uncharacterized protein n=1 Tax=Pseudoduganella namucuonensis TaxID=1035707 RepID=A0A1I7LPV3_9BURK|nr:hypothetical protein [Pseudoduganella namucuonensis]SFV11741.1 hypothetical protein SAMN05216552_103492 [Pseudoduganella namucuonensis]